MPTDTKTAPRRGKGAALNARITLATRKALLEEADRSGRSMSEVAEAWLDAAREGYAGTQGLACATDLRRMIAFARLVETRIGDPITNRTAAAALRSGMEILAKRIMTVPAIPPNDEWEFRELLPDVAARVTAFAGVAGDKRLILTSRPEDYFGDGVKTGKLQPKSGTALRLALMRLQELAASDDAGVAGEARALATDVERLVSLLPKPAARAGDAWGAELALQLLGEPTPASPGE